MTLILSRPSPQYDVRDQAEFRNALQSEDGLNFKRGQDVRLARGERLIIYSPNGTAFEVVVSNAGVLSAVAA